MDRKAFYDALRRDNRVFGSSLGAGQVKGIEGILDAFPQYGDGSIKTLAYALATTYHETGRRMVPVREGFASSDASARRAVNNLAAKRGPKSAVAKYAKPDPITGHVYYGRGRVQETWKYNYEKTAKETGIDFVNNPELRLDPVIDAQILLRGLIDGRWNGQGKGIGYYLAKDDLKNARRTVNVLDKWSEIAGYYNAFLSALNASGIPTLPKPAKTPTQTAKSTTEPIEASKRNDTLAIGFILTATLASAATFGEKFIEMIKGVFS